MDKYVKKERVIADAGSLGVYGRIAWYIQSSVADTFGGFSYRELNNPEVRGSPWNRRNIEA